MLGITPTYGIGNTRIRKNNQNITSILDIDFGNGLWIYVFPGQISQNDIWIKFRNFNIPKSKIRTPTHIHWAVDILIKKFSNRNLTDAFLNDMLNRWHQITPLPNRQMQTILRNLAYSQNTQFIARYQPLSAAGFFTIEFLTHLMELLMLQEKTNNPQAYMFKNVVNELLSYTDLYKILSTAGYRGK
jgi:hypothetical protein